MHKARLQRVQYVAATAAARPLEYRVTNIKDPGYSLGTDNSLDVFGSSNQSMVLMLVNIEIPRKKMIPIISAVATPIHKGVVKAYSQDSTSLNNVPFANGSI